MGESANSGCTTRLHASIRKRFAGRHNFQLDAEFEIDSGVTILFGRSGAGKSTLLNCLAGILEPDEGMIALKNDGKVRHFFDRRTLVPPSRRRIGYIFQSLALFPHLTVRENLEYGLWQIPQSERSLRTARMLTLFGIQNVAERLPDEISGGEGQRVALARTLITEPEVLLLDEPFNALDFAARNALLEDFRQWHSTRQVPILYVTHSRREALRLGTRMLLMESGRIAAAGDPESVLGRSVEFEE